METVTFQLGFIHKGFLKDAKYGNSRVFFVELSKVAVVNRKLCTNPSKTEKSNENASEPSEMSFSWSRSWKIYSDLD